ncbi:MAG: methyltransferase domain-containing protein [Rhodobiaceae bacterium]|nr:methyltransferase domain-containing protein [Rhodobiaceae bacterium]MCC0050084.1 methyltransferase domain-containing protein [Rhodobiaceae bacterium]
MNDEPMQLFDRGLLLRRRLRARDSFAGADFLLRRAAEDIAERLNATLRDFPLAVDLGARSPVMADELRRLDRVGAVVTATPDLRLLPQTHDAAIVCDEEFIPFAPESLDLIVSALSLHWINDLPGSLVQIRRALKPDGLFIAAIPGGNTLTELRQSLLAADAELTGGAAPRISPFADIRDLGALLQRAGFALPVVDLEPATVRYDSVFGLMRDLRAMGGTNALIGRDRKPMRRDIMMRAAEIYAERFSDPDGRIRATVEIIHLSGWAPHESQQKPLRPGSAQARLADALGTTEIPAGEKPSRK